MYKAGDVNVNLTNKYHIIRSNLTLRTLNVLHMLFAHIKYLHIVILRTLQLLTLYFNTFSIAHLNVLHTFAYEFLHFVHFTISAKIQIMQIPGKEITMFATYNLCNYNASNSMCATDQCAYLMCAK